MKELTTVSELYRSQRPKTGQQIRVGGWIRTLRDQKNYAFIALNDGSCFRTLQVVLLREKLEDYDELVRLGTGTAIVVAGELIETPEAKQPFEMRATSVQVEGDCPTSYPLQPKRHTPEYLRTIAHLRPRTNLYSAIFRVRSEAAFALHKFFNGRGFVYVHTPLITQNDCEGAGEMFSVTTLDLQNVPMTPQGKVDYSQDFFGKSTHLTVSGQLAVECYAQAFRNVYTFGPTFRAEHSNTPRHAAEFWMIEPEMAFADLIDDMDVAEAMTKSVVQDILDRCPDEIAFCDQFVEKGLLDKLKAILEQPFARITYTEAVELLKKCGKDFKYPVEWGMDLQTEHERALTEEIFKKPVFVTDYPKEIKAFYMKLNSDGKTVAAVDLLVPGIGELIGGSQREDDYETLLNRIQELKMDRSEYEWYLDLRRFGTTHHAGFGIGFERLIMFLTGASNIRDVIPFPRTVGTAEF